MATPAGAGSPRFQWVLGDPLGDFRPPTGTFDPTGDWEQSYAIVVIVPEAGGRAVKARRMGSLRLRRRAAGPTIEVAVSLFHGVCYLDLEATIQCAGDRLATPRRWVLRSRFLTKERALMPDTEVVERAIVEKGEIRRTGVAERRTLAPARFTANWCLFDVLQRLPGNDAEVPVFDLLEDLDLLKPTQRLSYRESVEVELGGSAVRLHGFEQFGRGILPYTYWLDDQRRVLMAVGGQRAYLYDPTVGPRGEHR